MGVKRIFSKEQDVQKVTEDFKKQLHTFNPKALMIFASWSYDHANLCNELEKEFPGVKVYGCSSYGEYYEDQYFKDSAIAMAFDEETLEDLHIEIIEDVHNDLLNKTKKVFDNFGNYYGIPANQMDFEKYVGMVLIDWCLVEEKVMDAIGEMTNVIFVGGTSADKDFVDFKEHCVFANGKTYRDAAVLVLMKPKTGFEVIKTQSFRVLNKKLTATKVDAPNRLVKEFNGKPALEAYAEAMNVPLDKAEDHFWTNPVGIVVTDHPFVRSPIPGGQNGDIMFCCAILENMEANLLQETEIIDETEILLKHIKKTYGDITGLIQFNCSARTIELENRDIIHDYAKIFDGLNHIGISCFGESYLAHINQSATMLLFK